MWWALVLLVLVMFAYNAREAYTPSATAETIFVSVASYRDSECMKTLEDMFAKAAHPNRIFVGACEQNTADDAESCMPSKFKHHSHVRRISIPHTEAKGPTYARYLCSTLYRGETYFMQIDSHSTFAQDWDDKVIAQQKACPAAKAVLSGYPHDRGAYGIDEKSVPTLCKSKFNADGLPQFEASVKSAKDVAAAGGKPWPIPFTSGGFLFAPGSILAEVPYDPGLPMLFQAEEALYSARAWTSGYDFFTCPVNIVFHAYMRDGTKGSVEAPKFWNDIKGWHGDQKKSAQRVRRILGLETPVIPPGSEPYALGTTRTIEEYWEFAGLDPAQKTSNSAQKFC